MKFSEAAVFIVVISWVLVSCSNINTEGENMRYGDLLAKLAQGKTLQHSEISMLRTHGNQMQLNNALVSDWAGATGDIDVDFMDVQDMYLEYKPLDSMTVQPASAISVPDSTTTYLTWGGKLIDYTSKKRHLEIDSSNESIIYVLNQQAKLMHASGTVVFSSNANGWRGIYFGKYNKTNTLLGAGVLAQLPPVSGTDTVIPFAGRISLTSDVDYIRFWVYQTSGATLSVSHADLTIFSIR